MAKKKFKGTTFTGTNLDDTATALTGTLHQGDFVL